MLCNSYLISYIQVQTVVRQVLDDVYEWPACWLAKKKIVALARFKKVLDYYCKK
jgi:hypothetical protein